MESKKSAFLQRASRGASAQWQPGFPRCEHAHNVETQAAIEQMLPCLHVVEMLIFLIP